MYFNGMIYDKLFNEYISLKNAFKISHCKLKLEISWNIIAHIKEFTKHLSKF